MNQLKAKKEQPKVVLVSIENPGEGRKSETKIIVPPGWKFSKKYASEVKLIDDKGRVQQIFCWECGTSQVYTYLYDDDPRALL